jgi:hypothetical protein
MSDDYLDRIRAVLDEHQIRTYRIEHRRRHRMARVLHAGQSIAVTFPSTGSDSRRGPLNVEADLRRAFRRTASKG